MSPIPKALRWQLSQDPFMMNCLVCGVPGVEFNHSIIYSGRQLQTWYAITPLCYTHHRGRNGTTMPGVHAFCELTAIYRGKDEISHDCPKVDWAQRKQYLIQQLCYLLHAPIAKHQCDLAELMAGGFYSVVGTAVAAKSSHTEMGGRTAHQYIEADDIFGI